MADKGKTGSSAGTEQNGRPPETSDGTCPICGKPRSTKYRPFCSKRCADIDLGRWLREVYTIPLAKNEAESDAEPSQD